ncbi:hypothetical protein Tdes44962_MAKER08566 [Teratosphaeria destructans]|uniref:Uncharacterized protein n=1 Tax=Teratosphaeria destructans TaxID=418781 RepID=A0A9W7SWB9_9PEZI|nr:hypothetical protein Tdes44962_MAKER08566 [Teratosphaeria destructans]
MQTPRKLAIIMMMLTDPADQKALVLTEILRGQPARVRCVDVDWGGRRPSAQTPPHMGSGPRPQAAPVIRTGNPLMH